MHQPDNQSINLQFASDNSNPPDHPHITEDTAQSEADHHNLSADHQGEDNHHIQEDDHPYDQGELSDTQIETHAQLQPLEEIHTYPQVENLPISSSEGVCTLPVHASSSLPANLPSPQPESSNTDADTISDHDEPGYCLKPRARHPPIRYGEWVTYDNNRSNSGSTAYIASTSTTIPEPKTYKEAMQSPYAQQWKAAMDKEFTSLLNNKTWELKPLPAGRKAVKCKWIFKVKYKPSGEVERFKARLVAKGFSQVAGIDFTETYAPVIKYDAVRAVFVISNEHGMVKAQFDVCTAYLNADLIDIIFMEQPEGYQDIQWPLYVCLLLKSLYGLKQSARR